MKRRGFLGLLGLAPAVPLIAKELSRSAEPVVVPQPTPQPGIWMLQPLDVLKRPWLGKTPVDATCRELEEGDISYISPPSENTRMVELTATFPCAQGVPMPCYSRVYFLGKPVTTMPTQAWGESPDGTLTIVQNIQIN